MLSFENDYSEGCHPRILEALTRTNLEQLPGYGADHYCAEAAEKIRAACQAPQAQVFFITGGTQTNQLAVDLLLHPTEGVVAAETGHVNTHEAGAIEYTGHKVMPLPAHNGKLQAQDLADLLRTFWDDASCEHMVAPGMVYLSHPTEYGTLYTRQELTDIAAVCRQYRIPLYLDGARLAYGLEAPETDLTLPEIARLCDVLYIGGTKVGALCGEALVFCQQPPARIAARIKQHGALNAKGRLLGIQFDVLFTDGLYFHLGRHAVELAMEMKRRFLAKGYRLWMDSPTNQQFILLEDAEAERLAKLVRYSRWEKPDAAHTVVRFATSWATTPEMLDELDRLLVAQN